MSQQVVCFGEILFDVLDEIAIPGGAPFNVAYHLKQAGIHSFLISSVGDDEYGKELLDMANKWNLDTQGIEVSDTYRTGIALVHYDEDNQPKFEIVHPVAWDYISWKDEYKAVIQQSEAFLFGSLSSRSELSYNTLKECLKHSPLNVFDINIRPPHFSRVLLEEILNQVHILKMNKEELLLLSEWYECDSEEESSQVEVIRKRFGIEEVLVTRGGEGASYYNDNVELHHAAIKIDVVDTIGSGDAFLAGFMSKRLDSRFSIEECLVEGLRKGAYVASQLGACPSYDEYIWKA